jgi:hypothetical protein
MGVHGKMVESYRRMLVYLHTRDEAFSEKYQVLPLTLGQGGKDSDADGELKKQL